MLQGLWGAFPHASPRRSGALPCDVLAVVVRIRRWGWWCRERVRGLCCRPSGGVSLTCGVTDGGTRPGHPHRMLTNRDGEGRARTSDGPGRVRQRRGPSARQAAGPALPPTGTLRHRPTIATRLVLLGRSGGALLLMVALLGGLPLLLASTIGDPRQGWADLSVGDVSDRALIDVLATLAYLFWVQFAVATMAELLTRALRLPSPPPLPGLLPGAQQLAGSLIGAALLATSSVPLAHAASPSSVAGHAVTVQHSQPAAATRPVLTVAGQATDRHATDRSRQAEARYRAVTIEREGPGTYWDLAQHHLGRGERWREIWSINQGRRQDDGTLLLSPNRLRYGWQILIPVTTDSSADLRGEEAREQSPPTALTAAGDPSQPARDLDATSSAATSQEIRPPAVTYEPADGSTPGSTSGRRTLIPTRSVHTVAVGDTLWSISEAQYPRARVGDVPRVVAALTRANRGVEDGHGRRFRDPDLINPGMRLQLPRVHLFAHRATERPEGGSHPRSGGPRHQTGPSPAPPATPAPAHDLGASATEAPPAPTPQASGPPNTMRPQPGATQTPTPATPPATAPPTSAPTGGPAGAAPIGDPQDPTDTKDQPDQGEDVASSIPDWLRGAGFLAAVFIALWAYRRRRRDSQMNLDDVAPPADEHLVPLHTAIRVSAEPDAVRRLDLALRWLALRNACEHAAAASGPRHRAGAAPAPAHVQAVLHATDGPLDVVLRESAALPNPWQRLHDDRHWRLPAEAPLSLAADAHAMSHPHPTLTQLGTTEQGRGVYVDLEAIGVLAIQDRASSDDASPNPGGPATPPSAATASRAGAYPDLVRHDTTDNPLRVGDRVGGGSAQVGVGTHLPTDRIDRIDHRAGTRAVSLRGIARAVTATLTAAPLISLLQIHTSGFDPFLAEERLHSHNSIDDLLSHIAPVAARLHGQLRDAGVESTLTLRATQADGDFGAEIDPVVVVATDRSLTRQHGQRLSALAGDGNRGVAVVVPAHAVPHARWILSTEPRTAPTRHHEVGSLSRERTQDNDQDGEESSGHGPSEEARWWRLEPLGVRIQPISVASDELADLAGLLREASTPPLPAQQADRLNQESENPGAGVAVAAQPVTTSAEHRSEPIIAGSDPSASRDRAAWTTVTPSSAMEQRYAERRAATGENSRSPEALPTSRSSDVAASRALGSEHLEPGAAREPGTAQTKVALPAANKQQAHADVVTDLHTTSTILERTGDPSADGSGEHLGGDPGGSASPPASAATGQSESPHAPGQGVITAGTAPSPASHPAQRPAQGEQHEGSAPEPEGTTSTEKAPSDVDPPSAAPPRDTDQPTDREAGEASAPVGHGASRAATAVPDQGTAPSAESRSPAAVAVSAAAAGDTEGTISSPQLPEVPDLLAGDWQVMVRLLGRPTLTGRDGTPAEGVRERTVETIAWLALHRHGHRTSLESALWPTGARAATVSNTISRARAALSDLAGPHAHAWIPHYQRDLRLDPAVTTDLDQLQACLTYATRHGRHDPEAAIRILRDGLALVTGIPVGWPWLDAELGSILSTTPTNAAAVLATLCLQTGDIQQALTATTIGLGILPAHRELFALRMRARAATGDLSAVRAEYEAYLRADNADPLTDGQPDRDLERLYLNLSRVEARSSQTKR